MGGWVCRVGVGSMCMRLACVFPGFGGGMCKMQACACECVCVYMCAFASLDRSVHQCDMPHSVDSVSHWLEGKFWYFGRACVCSSLFRQSVVSCVMKQYLLAYKFTVVVYLLSAPSHSLDTWCQMCEGGLNDVRVCAGWRYQQLYHFRYQPL